MPNPLQETIWLTQAAHEKLEAELAQLVRQNPTPAPEIDARIRELRALLRHADVSDRPDDGLVEPGMMVTVVFDGDSAHSTFLLAQRGLVDIDPEAVIDIYPPASPLGMAIVGKFPGDRFTFVAPSQSEVSGQIVSAVPFRSS